MAEVRGDLHLACIQSAGFINLVELKDQVSNDKPYCKRLGFSQEILFAW